MCDEFCDICWKRPNVYGMTFRTCRKCGVGVHDECYGYDRPSESVADFECWACQAVGTTVTVRGGAKIKIEERPTACCLCSVDDKSEWFHAMHPLYDDYGNTGRHALVPGKSKQLAWAHTLCCSYINTAPQTEGCVYGCTPLGKYVGEDVDEDNSDGGASVNSDLVGHDKDDITIHHYVFCLPLHGENAWTRAISDVQRELQCHLCGKNDEGTMRICTQCCTNDATEKKEFKKTHKNAKVKCCEAMHIGCSMWQKHRHKKPPRRTVFFFPGILDSGNPDKRPRKLYASAYCKTHTADLVRAGVPQALTYHHAPNSKKAAPSAEPSRRSSSEKTNPVDPSQKPASTEPSKTIRRREEERKSSDQPISLAAACREVESSLGPACSRPKKASVGDSQQKKPAAKIPKAVAMRKEAPRQVKEKTHSSQGFAKHASGTQTTAPIPRKQVTTTRPQATHQKKPPSSRPDPPAATGKANLSRQAELMSNKVSAKKTHVAAKTPTGPATSRAKEIPARQMERAKSQKRAGLPKANDQSVGKNRSAEVIANNMMSPKPAQQKRTSSKGNKLKPTHLLQNATKQATLQQRKSSGTERSIQEAASIFRSTSASAPTTNSTESAGSAMSAFSPPIPKKRKFLSGEDTRTSSAPPVPQKLTDSADISPLASRKSMKHGSSDAATRKSPPPPIAPPDDPLLSKIPGIPAVAALDSHPTTETAKVAVATNPLVNSAADKATETELGATVITNAPDETAEADPERMIQEILQEEQERHLAAVLRGFKAKWKNSKNFIPIWKSVCEAVAKKLDYSFDRTDWASSGIEGTSPQVEVLWEGQAPGPLPEGCLLASNGATGVPVDDVADSWIV